MNEKNGLLNGSTNRVQLLSEYGMIFTPSSRSSIGQKLLITRNMNLNENILQLPCFPTSTKYFNFPPCPKRAISQLTFTFMLELIEQKTKMYLTTPRPANAYQ